MGGILGCMGSEQVWTELAQSNPNRGISHELDTPSEWHIRFGVQMPEIQRGPFEVHKVCQDRLACLWYGLMFDMPSHQPDSPDMSPAHVLLERYRKFGEKFLDSIEGHFCGALWDGERKVLFLFVDPLGVKTLYWTRHRGEVAFACDASALAQLSGARPEVSDLAIAMWTCNDYDSTLPMWRDVHGLGAGQMVRISGNSSVVRSYPRMIQPRVLSYTKYEDYLEHFRETFFRGLNDFTTEGDATYLSGGMDSTSIAGALGTQSGGFRSFSYRFPTLTPCDESGFAKDMIDMHGAKGTFIDAEKGWLYGGMHGDSMMENPFIGWSQVDRAIFQTMQSEGCHHIFTGHGGDNLFSGDLIPYFRGAKMGLENGKTWRARTKAAYQFGLSPLMPRWLIRLLRGMISRRPHKPLWFSQGVYDRLDLGNRFFGPHPRCSFNGAQQIRFEFALFELWGILRAVHYMERLAAPFGVEVSHPFLDRRLIAMVLSIPPDVFFRNSRPKGFLRDAMAPFLPTSIIQRNDKPLLESFYFHSYLKHRQWIQSVLDQSLLVRNGWVDSEKLNCAVEAYEASKGKTAPMFFFPLNVEIWLKTHQKSWIWKP